MNRPTRSTHELERDFALARARDSTAAGTTLLHIGAEHTEVLSGHAERPEVTFRLAIGAQRTAAAFFRHEPPASHELEQAIDTVEDEVMRARTLRVDGTELVSTAAGLGEWARFASPAMTLETVEALFQRLASASLGHAGALAGLPAGREAAATLLILREFMHHLGYPAITVVDAARAPD
jgi:exopolyphosphatase/pppGpp-phosphohydrolase